MIKRFFAAIVAAAVFAGTVPAAADQVQMSPRASAELGSDGYLRGFSGVPTAEYIAGQFASPVTVTAPDGEIITGDTPVPSDSTVSAGGVSLAKVLVMGDADRDGDVDLTDAAAMLRAVAGWDVDICGTAADAARNGRVSLADVSAIIKHIAGWDVTLDEPPILDLSGFVILANDPETDAAVADALGIGITDEITGSQPYITVGTELWEKYSFIDSAAGRALFPESAYIDTYGGNICMTAGDNEGIEKCVELLASGTPIPKGYAGTAGHLTGESDKLYREAVERITAAELKHDGTNELTDDIMIALANAEYTEPKNFILMIGDGMGYGAVNGGQIAYSHVLPDGILAMNHLPVKGSATTYSADSEVTDSAAGGTALATGFKTSNNTVGMDQSHETELRSLTELASELGKSTGVVTTYTVVDATPATFSIHAESRTKMNAAAGKQLRTIADGTLDLLFGGGYLYFILEENQPAMDEALAAGLTFTRTIADAAEASLPVAGLFADYEINTTYGNGAPTLAEMTDVALEKLSEDEDGFFLMVEGGQIDKWGHKNMLDEALSEVYEFDCAVAAAMRYVALNPDTVLIITADHETGSLVVPPDSTAGELAESAGYIGAGHSWANVPVYAVGCGTGALEQTVDNTDIAILMAELMGESDFGMKSEVHTLLDLTAPDNAAAFAGLNPAASVTDNGVHLRLWKETMEYTVPMGEFDISPEEIINARAVHITMTNTDDSPHGTPNLRIVTPSETYDINEWWTYTMPGETVTYSYILPVELWYDGAFADITGIKLTCSPIADIRYEITDISVTDRPVGK